MLLWRGGEQAGRRAAAMAALAAASLVPAAAVAASAAALQSWWQGCVEDGALAACAGRHERLALAQAPGRAERHGAELRLRNGSEPGPGYSDREADPAGPGRHAYYLGSLDGLDADLVLILADGQAPQFDWLAAGSPSPLPLPALPSPSADGRWLLVVSAPDNGAQASITLVQKVGARWSQQFRYEPPAGLRYNFLGWRSDAAAVRLAWRREVATGCGPRQGLIQLRDGPYGWDFFPAPPAACP
jgi:hypothetical protein